MKILKTAIRVFIFSLLVFGVIYPALVTISGQLVFKHKADGSLILDEKGKVLGSTLIGQEFFSPYYFTGRPSDAGLGYQPLESQGSNIAIYSSQFEDRVMVNGELIKAMYDIKRFIPMDLLTSSASGLDPHISRKSAYLQIASIARERMVNPFRIKNLVDNLAKAPQFGVLGNDRVNVLKLNIELDKKFGSR